MGSSPFFLGILAFSCSRFYLFFFYRSLREKKMELCDILTMAHSVLNQFCCCGPTKFLLNCQQVRSLFQLLQFNLQHFNSGFNDP